MEELTPERRYEKFHPYKLLQYVADASPGLKEDYTVGLRMLVVRVGSQSSFKKAEKK